MKLYEYQAKKILSENGIAVPKGVLLESLLDVEAASLKVGFPLVIKAQVHVGGRGKAGGIRIVDAEEKLESELSEVLKMKIKDLKVKKVLLEEAIDIKKQFYFGIALDRIRQCHVMMVSSEGGVDIEEVAERNSEAIRAMPFETPEQISQNDIESLADFLTLDGETSASFVNIAMGLLKVYTDTDAQLLEINPLVLTDKNKLIACDAKMIIDDSALIRHEELRGLKEESEDNPLEIEAHRRALEYVKLSGNVGVIGNGAGLVMATMDEVQRAGGKPANFLDIGGGAKSDVMRNALDIIHMDESVRGIFINVFGGITRCDEVAEGIINALKDVPRKIPIVLRLTGTRAEEGKKILEKTDLISEETMAMGAQKIVSLINQEK